MYSQIKQYIYIIFDHFYLVLVFVLVFALEEIHCTLLSFFSQCMPDYFSPPNMDMDNRIVDICIWSFCMCVHEYLTDAPAFDWLSNYKLFIHCRLLLASSSLMCGLLRLRGEGQTLRLLVTWWLCHLVRSCCWTTAQSVWPCCSSRVGQYCCSSRVKSMFLLIQGKVDVSAHPG